MKRQFAKVPHKLLDLKENNTVKFTLIALLHFRQGNSKKIKVTLATLSKIVGIRERQLTKYMNKLIEHGLISRKQTIYGHNQFGSNEYELVYNDDNGYTKIDFAIAYNAKLPISARIGYCFLKRYSNKTNCKVRIGKKKLASRLQCSLNQVDKIKRYLKDANLIDYTAYNAEIILMYEMNSKKTADIENSIKKVKNEHVVNEDASIIV